MILIDKTENDYSAYSPDLPSYIATGASREEAEKNIHETIQLHIMGIIEDNLPIPQSQSFAEYVAV